MKLFAELSKMYFIILMDFREVNSFELLLLYVDNILDEVLDVEEGGKVLVL